MLVFFALLFSDTSEKSVSSLSVLQLGCFLKSEKGSEVDIIHILKYSEKLYFTVFHFCPSFKNTDLILENSKETETWLQNNSHTLDLAGFVSVTHYTEIQRQRLSSSEFLKTASLQSMGSFFTENSYVPFSLYGYAETVQFLIQSTASYILYSLGTTPACGYNIENETDCL